MNFPAEHDLRYAALLDAANAMTKVGSHTHGYYRYPARFGETFVRQAISEFSRVGDVVLDPFCGGGTTLVEALAAGRIAAGSDISELAVYLARAKTTPLSKKQLDKVGSWVAETAVSTKELLGAHPESRDERLVNVPSHSRNLVAELRTRAARLPRGHCQTFATCLLLKVFQWAYDGKEARPNPAQIVARLQTAFAEMRAGMMQFTTAIAAAGLEHADVLRSRFLRVGAAHSLTPSALGLDRPPVSLVVTSPPYLGVHVLYNRWQLQGRRELKVPFFLTGCKDIGGPAAYTIVARASRSHDAYYACVRDSFAAVARMLKPRAYVIQLVSFADASSSLPLYLQAMIAAGLEPCETYVRTSSGEFSWRSVPGRRWYARVGAVADSSASREVLLVHRSRS